jgi:uncharacterized membrane protein YecN with MAPEG domain
MTTEPFRREQCRVAAAMAAALLTALALLGFAFARAGASVPFADRLQATLRADLFVLLCLAAAIGDVARRRFFSVQDIAAAGPASPAVAAARSMLQNTLEQSVLAIGAHLALTAAFDRSAVPVAVLVGLFVAGRVMFYCGYRHGAGARAFGFALTFYPSVLALVAALALAF